MQTWNDRQPMQVMRLNELACVTIYAFDITVNAISVRNLNSTSGTAKPSGTLAQNKGPPSVNDSCSLHSFLLQAGN